MEYNGDGKAEPRRRARLRTFHPFSLWLLDAGGTYLEHIEHDHRPHAREFLIPHPRPPAFKAGLIPLHHAPCAEESHDPRTRLKGTEHDRHSAIFENMRNGLNTRPSGVDVGTEIGVQDAEGCCRETFGGEVDVAAGQWGRSSEKDGLLQGPLRKVGLDGGVILHHCAEPGQRLTRMTRREYQW